MIVPAELPLPLARYLAGFLARSQRLEFLRLSGIAAMFFLLWMVASCVADRYAQLSAGFRAALLVLSIGMPLWLLTRGLRRWRRKPDWIAAALAAEQANPKFSQKLITVTSQWLSRTDQRGSDQILMRLVEDVNENLSSHQTPRGPRAAPIVALWLAALGLTVFAVAFSMLLGRSNFRLLGRFFEPFADIAPVTTTQLKVSPGDASVTQSQPLIIRVDTSGLEDATPSLMLQTTSGAWNRIPMTPIGDGAFVATIASVDRDQRYRVVGGDARSPDFQIRTLRRPVISRFDYMYLYPDYTRLRPGAFHNDDGHIEAPIGSHVTMTVTSTEALSRAVFVAGGKQLTMTLGEPPTTARVDLSIDSNHDFTIDFTSNRGVSGVLSSPGQIRALPDLPPQVRIIRGGENLRLNPRGIIPVAYDAMDDYGLVSLKLQSDINGTFASSMTIPLLGDARRQQDTINFDLAKLNLAYGDQLTLTLIATDTGAHESRATPLQAFVTPGVVDLEAYQRMVELQRAEELEADVASHVSNARELVSTAQTQPSRGVANGRLDHEISGAVQSAALVNQALLRAITRSGDAKFTLLLAGWVDSTEVLSNSLQDVFRRRGAGTTGAGPADVAALAESQATTKRLAAEIRIILESERASALQSDLMNVSAARTRPLERDPLSRQRAEQTLLRMQQEVQNEAKQLGLTAEAGESKQIVQRFIDSGNRLLSEARPIEFGPVAEAWVERGPDETSTRAQLEARLSAASRAEAVRPDADLVRARDLDLSSHAVAAAKLKGTSDVGTSRALAGAIGIVADRPRGLSGLRPTTLPAKELAAINNARATLERIAGEPDDRSASAEAAGPGQKELESLAIAANAASATREYQRASDIESQMYRRLRNRYRRERGSTSRPQAPETGQGSLPDRIEHHRQSAQLEAETAKRLDALSQRQQDLARAPSTDAAELASRERNVADELTSIAALHNAVDANAPDSRERATSVVMSGIEQLAAMPQAVALAQGAAIARRAAARRTAAARKSLAHAESETREVLQRVLAGAERSESEAADRQSAESLPLQLFRVQALERQLGAYTPETDAARDVIQVRLLPTLADLQDSLDGDDAVDTARAAADALDAISATQRELAASRDLLMRRDPLAAARSFARLTADSLAASPPNLAGAKLHQAGLFEAISRAWDQSIYRAAQHRLASVPSMAALLAAPPSQDAATQPDDRFLAAQQWDRMRADVDAELDATSHDAEPAGYEEPLKLYFEALSHAQEHR